MSFENTNVMLTNDDPVTGLITQSKQLLTQASTYSQHDNNVLSFNGAPVSNSEQMKLYIPSETYVNYQSNVYKHNTQVKVKNLLIIMFIIIILCFIIFK